MVDDDVDLIASLTKSLNKYYDVDATSSGVEACLFASSNSYDCIILDLNLPDVNGLEVCCDIRKKRICTPVLMLTGEFGMELKILSLNIGADDYLTKPFDFEELLARIKALIRRNGMVSSPELLEVADLIIDLGKKIAIRKGRKIELRRKEYEILEYLVRNKGKVIPKERILNHIWGLGSESSLNIVEVHMCSLRERLDKGYKKKLIRTMYGRGYKIGD